jgi:hypothetical protein
MPQRQDNSFVDSEFTPRAVLDCLCHREQVFILLSSSRSPIIEALS